MAEEITDFVANLRIDEEEEQIIDFDFLNPSNENHISLLLIGRLLTECSYNIDAFKRTITTVWAPQHGLVIRTLKPNLYAFQFYHWRDMAKVMEGRPWCFDNMIVLLKEAEGDEQPDQVTLHHSPFWVRLKNLPFNMSSNDVVKALICNMGEILEIEEDVLGVGRYRRVKVMLDVFNPLRRYRKLRDKKGKEMQVDFAYERLPYFCLACGIMGHSEKDCHSVTDEERCERLGWHLSLKATPRKGRKKEVQEELKFKNCKKVLFECKNTPKQGLLENLTTTELGLCSDPKVPHNLAALNRVGDSLIVSAGEDSHAQISAPIGGAKQVNDTAVPPLTNSFVSTESGMYVPQHVVPSPNEHVQTPMLPYSEAFVFSSLKETKGPKKKAWKRLAYVPVDDKGSCQSIKMDPVFMDNKRPSNGSVTVGEYDDNAMKRSRLSLFDDVAPVFPTEVGEDQPRQAL